MRAVLLLVLMSGLACGDQSGPVPADASTDQHVQRDTQPMSDVPDSSGGGIDGSIRDSATPPEGELLAFPTAEGGGAMTVGGRGGRVIEVINLEGAGPGSFREACQATGPRTIVFRVGGTIDLAGEDVHIDNDFVTVAGQTATGDGIQIRGGGLRVAASEVILRYLRLRPGAAHSNVDALSIGGQRRARQRNIMVDHISAYWAVDENVDAGSFTDNITVQWSIVAEGLEHPPENAHAETNHSRGLMVTELSRNVTLHHNLFFHNFKRNPLIQSSDADVVNNLMVNYQYQVFVIPLKGEVHANFIANTFRTTNPRRSPVRIYDCNTGSDEGSTVFAEGNLSNGGHETLRQEIGTDSRCDGRSGPEEDGSVVITSDRYSFREVETQTANEAQGLVLAQVGASYPNIDSADQRVLAAVRAEESVSQVLINDPSEVGGWPELLGADAPADQDHDGMPDVWEATHGLDPNDPADGALSTLSRVGYTNLEMYLNGLTP